MRIDGRDAVTYDHFSLRQLLTSEVGRKVSLVIGRNGREIETTVVLMEK